MQIQISRQYTEIIDSQRRVYIGCVFSSRQSFKLWETLESGLSPEEVDQRLEFWVDLNNYAVSQRGEQAETNITIKD